MGHIHSKTYPPSREVITSYGPIVGRRLIYEGERQVDAFQGIPYAKSPVGPLRFKKPVRHESWTDVRECKAFGSRSIQKPGHPEKIKLPPVSEDCLTLNIFTPVWEPQDKGGFAVLVFIHGGAFVSDSACKYGDVTLCEHICKKDVVMVTLQYRLGYLGMWSTGDECCSGNLLLWDQTFALQWIKDNITHFNGNPNNITLMGQSAGGCSVDILSLSPHSRDLFHKVIPMAGNASCPWSISHDNVEICRSAAESFGVTCCQDSETYLEELRKLPADIFSLSMQDFKGVPHLGPRIDGDFLPKHPDELRKEAPKKPRLYGMCRSEGLIFSSSKKTQVLSDIDAIAARLFPEANYENFAKLRKEYVVKVKSLIDDDKESIVRAICQASGDEFLGIGTQKAVIQCLNNNDGPIYLYRMDYFDPKSFGGMISFLLPFKDATHCTDISFIVSESIGLPCSFDEEDMKIVEKMTTWWTNFAKYGDPNDSNQTSESDIKWLPATREYPQRHIQIDKESNMSDIFFDGRPLWYLQQSKRKD